MVYGSIMAKPKLKVEALRLRVEDRLSLREIREKLGVSKGTLSVWLRDHPLTEAEKQARRGPMPPRPHKRYDPGPASKYQQMVCKDLSSEQKGQIAEAAVLYRLVLLGWTPSRPVFEGHKADWFVEVNRSVISLQVKWARTLKSGGSPLVSITTSGPNSSNKRCRYTRGDFDYLIGYDLWRDEAHVFSWEDLEGHKRNISCNPSSCEAWDKIFKV